MKSLHIIFKNVRRRRLPDRAAPPLGRDSRTASSVARRQGQAQRPSMDRWTNERWPVPSGDY